MSLEDLLQNGQNIIVAVKIDDLLDFANTLINRTRTDLTGLEDRYLNQKQAALMIGVEPATLWRWNKEGKLCSSRVGKQRIYKLREVHAFMNGRHNGRSSCKKNS